MIPIDAQRRDYWHHLSPWKRRHDVTRSASQQEKYLVRSQLHEFDTILVNALLGRQDIQGFDQAQCFAIMTEFFNL